jgi:hypothetical protein
MPAIASNSTIRTIFFMTIGSDLSRSSKFLSFNDAKRRLVHTEIHFLPNIGWRLEVATRRCEHIADYTRMTRIWELLAQFLNLIRSDPRSSAKIRGQYVRV